MKFVSSCCLVLVSVGLFSVQAAIVKRLDETEPKDEICILSIVPCPEECPDTCIYPDLPCPKQYPPHCPGDKKKPNPKEEHPKREPTDLEICTDHPCPRVRFKPCPEECPHSCHFVNEQDPCCPFSGEPVCQAPI